MTRSPAPHPPDAGSAGPDCLLVEASRFAEFGGWVLDPQALEVTGAPCLLAHGLGTPVADASTAVEFPGPGIYRAWVRTRDWVAPWGLGSSPGRFQLLVDGAPLATTFGTEGAAWHWQDGGLVRIDRPRVTLALRDRTGFEGRCEAVCFSADRGFVPPEDRGTLDLLRRRASGLPGSPEEGGTFDLVVTGGGIAGMCAAVAAARYGLSVALVQDRPVLGGNNSSEVRVWLNGDTNLEPWPRIGDLVREFEPAKRAHTGPANAAENYEDAKRIDRLRAERGLALRLGCRVTDAETTGGRIAAVVARDVRTGRRLRLAGRLFADCTGDGAVGALAGADLEITRTGHMGPSNLWNVVDTGRPAPFPRCPWAPDLSGKPFPGRDGLAGQWSGPGLENLGQWFWECGFDGDPVADVERMRDWNLLAMYAAWDALKNVDRRYPNHRLGWAAFISGKRESRRLLGDVVLTREDVVSERAFDDACFPCTWGVDLHVPHPAFRAGFEGREFIAEALVAQLPRPYWASYRCLYSRNVGNLFMAGRDISVTHEALGTVRVMRTGGMMGEIVGMAAALCARHGTTPRGVYRERLDGLHGLMRDGVPRR